MHSIESSVFGRQCVFLDREGELAALDGAWRDRPCFMVVYGRRRVGKTRLIAEWMRSRGVAAVYYLAQLASHRYNLRRFAERAAEALGDPLIARMEPRELGDLLEMIARVQGDVAVIVDEFTYWARSSPRVLGELQGFVDGVLPGTRMLLIVSGSLVGVMERAVLGGGSPLYGRATHRLRLSPLPFRTLRELLGGWSPADRVRLYALMGGIPFYLCLASRLPGIREAVYSLILAPDAPLRDEKDMLLREEFRDPHAYSAILSAIARGHDTPSRMAQATGLDPGHVSRYLWTLEHLGFVERRVPLFAKKGRYTIADPVLRAWYELVEPVADLLELGRHREALNMVLGRLDTFTAPLWERLVRSHLLDKYSAEGYSVAGFLQHRGEELDAAVLDPHARRAVVAEAKWSALTLDEAWKLREEARRKAYALLPKGYTIAETYVAARSLAGGEKPGWIILPGDLEA